jgi:hypothetical protein
VGREPGEIVQTEWALHHRDGEDSFPALPTPVRTVAACRAFVDSLRARVRKRSVAVGAMAIVALLWYRASGGTAATTASFARLKEQRSYLVRILCLLWRRRFCGVGGIGCVIEKSQSVNADGRPEMGTTERL